jgi:tripartite-type tricarboxylate transporter receptor subunit TctC
MAHDDEHPRRRVAKHLRQRVEVRNMPGASGTLGAIALKDAAPDGYTVSQISDGTFRLPHLLKDGVNPGAEFTWVIGVTAFAYGVAVNASSPWKTWGEFVAAARATPGAITYATTSVGGVHNRIMEVLATKESIKWAHTPFREGGQATDALVEGKVDAFVSSTGWGDLISAGKIRMLVSWSAIRPSLWPDVPTLKELGYDLVVDGPYGLAGPRNMDPKVVRILHDAFRKAMADPTYLNTIEKLGQEPWYRSSEDYATYAAESFDAQRRALSVSRGEK